MSVGRVNFGILIPWQTHKERRLKTGRRVHLSIGDSSRRRVLSPEAKHETENRGSAYSNSTFGSADDVTQQQRRVIKNTKASRSCSLYRGLHIADVD